MYVNPAFRVDTAASLAFAAARGFGLVIGCDEGRPLASSLPFQLDPQEAPPRAEFHVARGNPLAELAAKGGSWLLAVTGANTYVSPDWYASADQVPTWLYQSVHLSGPVRLMTKERQRQHLDRLSATFETRLAPKPPWTTDKLTPSRLDVLFAAIVGIEMAIETVTGSFKLNQNKKDADYQALADQLAEGDEAARTIAGRMVELRPHLTYGSRAREAARAVAPRPRDGAI